LSGIAADIFGNHAAPRGETTNNQLLTERTVARVARMAARPSTLSVMKPRINRLINPPVKIDKIIL